MKLQGASWVRLVLAWRAYVGLIANAVDDSLLTVVLLSEAAHRVRAVDRRRFA